MADRGSLRAFVAIEVPAQVLDSLEAAQKELSASGADLKLVERSNLHFTVKFLGEISDSQASEADARLRRLHLVKSGVEVRGVGAFPSPARPRVVWAGVSGEDASQISAVAGEVLAALDGIGERDDRPFQPHLTLARVRSDRNIRQLQEAIGRVGGHTFGHADLESLKLKSSQLTPSGPIYRDVGVYPFA
jgi:RNA 2',3'-cyclic 3'-phosphodiesterase